MQNEIQYIELLSGQLGQIIAGTFFLFIGLVSAAIFLLRREKDFQILIWLGAWSGSYGLNLLLASPAVNLLVPHYLRGLIPIINVTISYMILVFALFAWVNLTRGKFRTYLKVMIMLAFVDAFAGIYRFIVAGSTQTFLVSNNLMATSTLVVFMVIISIKKLSDKYLILPNRGVLAVGSIIFIAEALYSNLSQAFGYQTFVFTGWIGFAALLLALAYTAAKMIFTNERRLITIENEMETARQIQSSILPQKVPEIEGLDIAAAYYPMTSVAGDFYDFIEISKHEAGFLIADVSGHGVPAALIASMIKIAMQSVIPFAKDPCEVLKSLEQILRNQLHGQFVTAAYLYVNSQDYQARYSAAGHPPLLCWNSSLAKLESIESNGLPFGIPADTTYPVHEFTFSKNDRFFIYSDGVTETRNTADEEFGDHRLSELIYNNKNLTAEKFREVLLHELKLWQDKKLPRQDDITFVIITAG